MTYPYPTLPLLIPYPYTYPYPRHTPYLNTCSVVSYPTINTMNLPYPYPTPSHALPLLCVNPCPSRVGDRAGLGWGYIGKVV